MATFYAGKKGAVSIGPEGEGVLFPFDSWTLSCRADPIDCSDYDQPTRNYLHDLQAATLNFSGPYSDDLMDLHVSDKLDVQLYLDEEGAVSFSLTTLVTEFNLRTDVRGVARLEVSGVATGNFMESVADEFTKEVVL